MNHPEFSELTWHAWLAMGVVVAVLTILASTRWPADFVFLGGLGVLMLSGVLPKADALGGFSNSGMITVAVLYVVVTGLEETGALNWISETMLGRPKRHATALARLMLPVVGLSAFLNNTPVVAMFIPVVTRWARRIGLGASQLLIPLSYAAIFGGICTLIGTSTNLVVNGMVQKRFAGGPLAGGLGMFEIAKIGLPCALVGMAYLLTVGRRLLPAGTQAGDVFHDPREYTLEMLVREGSPLDGRSIEQAGLRHLQGAYVAELIRGGIVRTAVAPAEILRAGDRLVFVGKISSIQEVLQKRGLDPATDQIFRLDAPRHERCLVEAVVSDTCPLVGRTIREGRFRQRYNAVVLAVSRNGRRIQDRIGDIRLRAGDNLLIESHAGFIPRQRESRDFYLISGVDNSAPLRHQKAWWAVGILAAMVLAAALQWMDMLYAALAAAGAMLALRCCSPDRARKSIEWNVLLVIAAALAIGVALETTGAAGAIAGALLSVTGDSPGLALAGVYLTVAVFTEIITNNAAAALVFPIAMNTAARLGASPMPFIMCIMIGASASFATPIGYQTNMMVYGPGGYRFADYLRVGIPLDVLMAITALTLAPLIWPF